MKRKSFARLCLLASVLGLGIMYASTQMLQPEKISLEKVSPQDIGKTVRLEGAVTNFYRKGSTSFFKLVSGNESIPVTSFSGTRLSEGVHVLLNGRVELYQGELQIVSTEIEQK